jgi:serine/threonine protein kinase
LGHAFGGLELPSNYTGVVELGAGGMGVVYKAYDSAMNREVAIKVIRDADFTQAELKRFVGEAKALGRLDHTNIIKVHSIGQLESGQPYILLEYFDGESLDTVIERQGRFSIADAMQLFHQMAAALKHAHSKGVVHRDIKPSNVLASMGKDGKNTFRLLDFGIARFIDTAKTQDLTKSGSMIGSPAYASPEQCNGTKVDHRSDIYSLGCLMYEVVAGRPPFVADNPMELMISHCSEAVPPMSLSAPGSDVPDGFERIIRKCLQKEPQDRFADASELVAALEVGDTTYSEREAAPIRKGTWEKRRLLVPALATAVLLSAATAAVVLTHHQVQAPAAMPASRYAEKAKTIRDQLTDEFTVEQTQKRHEIAALYEEATRQASPTDPQRADYFYNLGQESILLQRNAKAEASFRSAIASLGPYPEINRKREYVLCLTSLASSLAQQHRYQEALAELQTCLKSTSPRTKARAKTLLRMGQQYVRLNKFPEAEKLLLAAKEEYEGGEMRDNGEYASVMLHLGQVQKDTGRFNEARKSALLAKQIADDIQAKEQQEQAKNLLKELDSAEKKR